jgi:hypothetical protein
MMNDHLSNEEAKQYIDQRRQEVETMCQHQRLGYNNNRATRWILLIILVIAVALEILL